MKPPPREYRADPAGLAYAKRAHAVMHGRRVWSGAFDACAGRRKRRCPACGVQLQHGESARMWRQGNYIGACHTACLGKHPVPDNATWTVADSLLVWAYPLRTWDGKTARHKRIREALLTGEKP